MFTRNVPLVAPVRLFFDRLSTPAGSDASPGRNSRNSTKNGAHRNLQSATRSSQLILGQWSSVRVLYKISPPGGNPLYLSNRAPPPFKVIHFRRVLPN